MAGNTARFSQRLERGTETAHRPLPERCRLFGATPGLRISARQWVHHLQRGESSLRAWGAGRGGISA